MKIGNFDTDSKVLVIAEIGNNHEGSFALAEEMIGLAAEAGVDAVKFQTFRSEEYVSRSDEARFKRLKSFELSHEQFTKLSTMAAKAGVLFLSTPFDLVSARFLNEILPAFKIGSGENTFFPLIELVASFKKPIIFSCGITEIDEIYYTKALIEKIWREQGAISELGILHCVSSYPTPPEMANLRAIRTLTDNFNCTIGYSDHTLGIEAAVASVALGARIVEKHFTVNKKHSEFRDHQLSADPPEMKALVERVAEISTMLGTGEKRLGRIEEGAAVAMRRSIVAKRDMPADHCLSLSDITWVRPGGGLRPGSEGQILGRRLKKSVKENCQITLEMF